MARRAQPFKYRGAWRAQVTLKNGTRPFRDFTSHGEAGDWITDQLANANTETLPELGGPSQASLAEALAHYAGLNTITKGGYSAEIDRINHYLEGADIKPLKIVTINGKRQLILKETKKLPSAFKANKDTLLHKREGTYKLIAALGRRKCSTLCTADFRRLMVSMKNEGLSDSTIQKEIALLKHLFNVVAAEWNWKGFDNPCAGLKLGGSNQRFVFMTQEQRVALRQALAECDNPYFWPLVEVCMQTTLRKGSLLAMTRSNVDLGGRVAMLPSKTGPVSVPLSQKAVETLQNMAVHPSGKYFPMSGNAIDMAWDGVRRKIGMPQMQFKDLRHIGATDYARAGANGHQLQKMLGHKSSRMADVYVNLVGNDILEFMDRVASSQVVYNVPAPASGTGEEMLNRNRSKRLTDALVKKILTTQAPTEAPVTPAHTATDIFLAQHGVPATPPSGTLGCASAQNALPGDGSQEIQTHTTAQKGEQANEPEDALDESAVNNCALATGTNDARGQARTVTNNVVMVDFRRKG
jgi:integrase